MSDVNKMAELEAELMELRSRPSGIGDGDIQRLFNQRDELREMLFELENAAGCLYPCVLMLCDDETSRPSMKTARKIVDMITATKVMTRAKNIAKGTNE